MSDQLIRATRSLECNDAWRLLEVALLEYAVRYGFTDKARAALLLVEKEGSRR